MPRTVAFRRLWGLWFALIVGDVVYDWWWLGFHPDFHERSAQAVFIITVWLIEFGSSMFNRFKERRRLRGAYDGVRPVQGHGGSGHSRTGLV